MAKYCIKKKMINTQGKSTYVLLTNGYSEILEYDSRSEAEQFALIMNNNTDSGWVYEVLGTLDEG